MGKTNIMKFTPNTRQNETFQIIYHNKILTGTNNTNFLGLELDKNVNWKKHIQKILPKLSSACYLIRKTYPSCNLNTLRMIYFAYFHSATEYGIIFWGNSVESKRIFLQQKRILRNMSGSPSGATCRTLFCELKILTLTSQYILSLMRFLSSNLDFFTFNSSVHNINTRLGLKLHKPSINLKIYQRSSYYNCTNVYNKLPEDLAALIQNKRQFILQIKKFLINKPYYSLQEFLDQSVDP